jgi:NAD(P)-dependent dehydrogenase (short-subunit alcohol dehydrogenase family)
VVTAITQAGAPAIAVQADVGDEEQVRAMVDRTAREFGGLDTLVNNAAKHRKQPAVMSAQPGTAGLGFGGCRRATVHRQTAAQRSVDREVR